MSLKPLTAENMQNGALLEAFNDAIVRVSTDITRRPLIQKDREITVTVKINPGKPVDDKNGMRVMPFVNSGVRVKLPGVACMEIRTLIQNHNGESVLMVNTDDPSGDPRQGTIFDNLPRETEEVRKPYKED